VSIPAVARPVVRWSATCAAVSDPGNLSGAIRILTGRPFVRVVDSGVKTGTVTAGGGGHRGGVEAFVVDAVRIGAGRMIRGSFAVAQVVMLVRGFLLEDFHVEVVLGLALRREQDLTGDDAAGAIDVDVTVERRFERFRDHRRRTHHPEHQLIPCVRTGSADCLTVPRCRPHRHRTGTCRCDRRGGVPDQVASS